MREHPSLFNGPMVRAILDRRKRMTRRPAKWPKWATECCDNPSRGFVPHPGYMPMRIDYCESCGSSGSRIGAPWQPGDLLWVRETHWINEAERLVAYRAGGEMPVHLAGAKWRPSIHMPRWASRITLRVTDARVERVQEITEEDAWAEGSPGKYPFPILPAPLGETRWVEDGWDYARDWFADAWDAIYAPRGYGWDANLYVWAYAFEVLDIRGVSDDA